MTYSITEHCVSCFACVDVCPSGAILETRPVFTIAEKKCTHCEGAHAVSQCASICPVEGAILDPLGEMANPPGSLTGIPPEKRLAAGLLV